ncbi:hypothetical protein GOP47_0004666, partial [Adiantum capillus-veneris]
IEALLAGRLCICLLTELVSCTAQITLERARQASSESAFRHYHIRGVLFRIVISRMQTVFANADGLLLACLPKLEGFGAAKAWDLNGRFSEYTGSCLLLASRST